MGSDASEDKPAGRKNWKKALVQGALQQGVRAPYEPENEVMDIELRFLWIMFLVPITPFCAMTTLIASLFKTNFGLVKMIYMQRRPFPRKDRIMRSTHSLSMFGIS